MPTMSGELVSRNPATEAIAGRYPVMTATEIDAALEACTAAQVEWAVTGHPVRAGALRRLATVLRERAVPLAAVMTEEMGKPLTEARAEVEKCAVTCEHFADHAATYLADIAAPSNSARSRVHFQPLGVVLACMPWNFPLWQVIRCAVPALAAGNGVVLKHADGVTGCAVAMQACCEAAGFPTGLFVSLVVPVPGVAGLIADRRVHGVSLTGSTTAGEAVGAQAGAALKKAVLELGGSDAFVVLDDADVAAAAATAVRSRFQNNGQSCIAAKRFIVDRSVAGEFTDALVAGTTALRMGDPTNEATQLGPLARGDLRDRIEAQIATSCAQGATLLTGGTRPAGPGYFLAPAVLADCSPEMTVCTDETFGPVAAIITVDGDAEAVRVANASDYGLGGNIWTGDDERGLALAEALNTGGVFINGMTHSDARLPFGGVGRSGYGRELHALGIREFVNAKTIWVADR